MNYVTANRSGFSEYRYPVGWMILVVSIAACATSYRTNTQEDSDSDSATNKHDSSSGDSDSDANPAGFGSDVINTTHGDQFDGATVWINDLNERFDSRSNADAQSSTTEIEIEASSTEIVPVGQWLGQSGNDQESDCDQTKRIVIQIAPFNDKDGIFGFVTFGDKDPPPPAVDPEVGYPPGFDSDPDTYDFVCHGESYANGYPYSIRDGRIEQNGRFTFRIAEKELYQTWCSLQTSYQLTEYDYRCAPQLNPDMDRACEDLWKLRYAGDYSEPTQGLDCPMDLGKYILCGNSGGPCHCYEQGCVASTGQNIRFDLMLGQDTIQGVMIDLSGGIPSPSVEVRLQRID